MKSFASWQNVLDGNGVQISLVGMFIVFSALLLISLAIWGLPHMLKKLEPILPKDEHYNSDDNGSNREVDQKVALAVAVALNKKA